MRNKVEKILHSPITVIGTFEIPSDVHLLTFDEHDQYSPRSVSGIAGIVEEVGYEDRFFRLDDYPTEFYTPDGNMIWPIEAGDYIITYIEDETNNTVPLRVAGYELHKICRPGTVRMEDPNGIYVWSNIPLIQQQSPPLPKLYKVE